MACSICGSERHNAATCPRRLRGIIDEQQRIIDDHERRLGILENWIRFFSWMFAYVQVWCAIATTTTMIFLRFAEISPFITSANLFLLMVTSFAAGFLLGWILRATFCWIYYKFYPEPTDPMPENTQM
jgi:hypothetical protein